MIHNHYDPSKISWTLVDRLFAPIRLSKIRPRQIFVRCQYSSFGFVVTMKCYLHGHKLLTLKQLTFIQKRTLQPPFCTRRGIRQDFINRTLNHIWTKQLVKFPPFSCACFVFPAAWVVQSSTHRPISFWSRSTYTWKEKLLSNPVERRTHPKWSLVKKERKRSGSTVVSLITAEQTSVSEQTVLGLLLLYY